MTSADRLREAPSEAQEMRSLAHRAVTEGVDLRYVDRMRKALYSAADRLERLEAVAGALYDQCEMTDQALRLLREMSSDWEAMAEEECDPHDPGDTRLAEAFRTVIDDLDTADGRAALKRLDEQP